MTHPESVTAAAPDHGGNLDAACQQYGGSRAEWIDLSTGINPVPYPIPNIPAHHWTDLPDQSARDTLLHAARRIWSVPDHLGVLPANGASALIAALPGVFHGASVHIPGPTYNEHAVAFRAAGWSVTDQDAAYDARVLVHPNNPDGHHWTSKDIRCTQLVIDESFADCEPSLSLIRHLKDPDQIILKSFGKFWGLAGVRLGFAIGAPETLAALRAHLGPWSASGPALHVGALALSDTAWAENTRARLSQDAARLDRLMAARGVPSIGGTPLFRLYKTPDAAELQTHLATHKIWSRVFPYDPTWLRLGLPAPDDWPRVDAALRA